MKNYHNIQQSSYYLNATLFTGQRLDDTGMFYYGTRCYDQMIGRFISPDTLVPDENTLT